MTRLALALCLVLLAACGRSETPPYPPAYEVNFKTACETRTTPARCACIWDKIEDEVDPNAFAALEQLPLSERQAHPLTRQIEGYALACRGTPPVEQPPAP